jgi:hypothetical protein
MTDIAIMAARGTHLHSHIHGVEPVHGSKFWATEDDGYLSSNLEEENEVATPMLMTKALEANFTEE